MRCPLRRWLLLVVLLALPRPTWAQATNPTMRSLEDRLLDQASSLFVAGRGSEAIKFATQAIELNTNHLRSWSMRGRFHQETGQPEKAVADFNQVVRLDPNNTNVWSQLGTEHFILGNFEKSLDCFDRFLKAMPQLAPGFWQRGIVAFEAGKYAESLKQFQDNRELDTNDVEVVVWQFLCIAKTKGLERARLSLLPVENDPRVPMREIHRMFAGTVEPKEVLRVATMNTPGPPENAAARLNDQMFYAHLYVGLYDEALGKLSIAADHVGQAAVIYRVKGFMGELARVHADVLRQRITDAAPKPGGNRPTSWLSENWRVAILLVVVVLVLVVVLGLRGIRGRGRGRG